MIEVTIVFCSWCNSERPIRVTGADGIPPGKHLAHVQISHGMCDPCGTKFSDGIGSKGVTQSGTVKGDDAASKISG
jgi:hypothetical protein